MIHGVGVDLVHLPRFDRFARDHARRLSDLFSPAERAAFRSRRALAGAWAMKEATLKAIGGLSGWDVNWREIGIRPGAVRLSGAVARHARSLGVSRLDVSTATMKDAIVATVVATGP